MLPATRQARFSIQAEFLVTGDKGSGLLARSWVDSARLLTAAVFCKVGL